MAIQSDPSTVSEDTPVRTNADQDAARLASIRGAIAKNNERRQQARSRPTARPPASPAPAGVSEADRLNNLYLETNKHGGRFVSTMDQSPGSQGEAMNNIMNRRRQIAREAELEGMKKGGPVKKMAKGGAVKSSASSRSDGCAVKGKTKGRMV
jgi:hypothetical protein